MSALFAFSSHIFHTAASVHIGKHGALTTALPLMGTQGWDGSSSLS
jgi:hypothetical protein